MIITFSSLTLAEETQACTGEKLPLQNQDQIIEAVICETGGNVLKTQVVANEENGNEQYNVRVLMPGGTVRIFTVDSATGLINPDEAVNPAYWTE